MQPKWSMDHVPAALSTSMAEHGQRFTQIPHRMHFAMSISTVPRWPAGMSRFSSGYMTVSGLPNSERRVIFPSLKLPIALPFRTADTRVDRQNDVRNIGQIAPFERFHHAGKILRGGRAHAHAFQVRRAVAQRVVIAFAARLLEHVARLSASRRLELALLADAVVGNLGGELFDDGDRLVHFRTTI